VKTLSPENLQKGISFWINDKPHWPRDLHYSFYCDLIEINKYKFTDEWWKRYIDLLWSWVAIRPKTKNDIYLQGLKYLSKIAKKYTQKDLDNQTINSAHWKDISEFFDLIFKIKNVKSPVFTSKMSHFINPSLFPVIDGEVIGLKFPKYKEYWEYIQDLWVNLNQKEELINILENQINASKNHNLLDEINLKYPYPTKITELCLIGEKF